MGTMEVYRPVSDITFFNIVLFILLNIFSDEIFIQKTNKSEINFLNLLYCFIICRVKMIYMCLCFQQSMLNLKTYVEFA